MNCEKKKKHYLFSINCTLMPHALFGAPLNLERLKEKLWIIYRDNTEEWADSFVDEEIIPLLNRHGITVTHIKGGVEQ